MSNITIGNIVRYSDNYLHSLAYPLPDAHLASGQVYHLGTMPGGELVAHIEWSDGRRSRVVSSNLEHDVTIGVSSPCGDPERSEVE